MESVNLDREKGQILVQVAIMVVVLFAFVALALDVGHVYAGRRRMQNAADAGALAGAREICFGDPAQAELVARQYAERNGAEDPEVDIPDDQEYGGYTVIVTTGQALDTFFAGVIGIDTANVRAEAAATCGSVRTVCNVWPVAFDTTTFTKTQATCPTHVLLWTDDFKADCGPDSKYICNCPDPGDDPADLDDLATVADGRAWLDFTAITPGEYDDPCDSPGGGESELEYRILGENNKGDPCLSYIRLDSCAAGSVGSGSAIAAWRAAGEMIDEIVFIPLYDPARSSPDNPCTMDHDPGSNVGNQRYFLTDVACVRVHATCRLCERDRPTHCTSGPHVIEVEMLCKDDGDCTSNCATTFGEIPQDGDVKAVNLVPYP